MGYKLCIAEKPSVAKDIARVIGATERESGYIIGGGYIVTWAVGHLVGLAEPEAYGYLSQAEMWDKDSPENVDKAYEQLPLLPEKFKTIVLPKAKEQYKIVEQLMRREDVDYIIDCGDMGAEGHILQWLIRDKVGTKKLVKRFCATSMTDEAIRYSMENLHDIEDFASIITGEFCKKKADWIMGMSMSRCCSIKYHSNISVGRVQSPTLYFVVKRFLDVNSFKVTDFYQLEAEFAEGFKTFWTKDSDNKFSPQDKDDSGRLLQKTLAEKTANEIKGFGYGEITTLQTKNKAADRPQLYDITELERDGNHIFGYTADKTLKLAQSLYETHKILSYPRTDSRYITSDLVPYMAARIKAIGSIARYAKVADFVTGKGLNLDKRIVDDSKVTDHHALIVTERIENFDCGKLDTDEQNILHLVISRMLTSFSERYTYKETEVAVTFPNGFVFAASGRMPVSLGWKNVQKSLLGKLEEAEEKSDDEQLFSGIELGQTVTLACVNVLAKKTTPPKLHTEATLLTAMENAGSTLENGAILKGKGIGTQATRAAIIKALFDKKYIADKTTGKTHFIVPTKQGATIIQVLPSDLYSPQITADWEEKIAGIVDGKLTEGQFMSEFEQFIRAKVAEVKESRDAADFSTEREEVAKCPFCGSGVYAGKITNSKTGKTSENFYCSDKSCKFMLSKDNVVFVSRTGKNATTAQMTKLITDGALTVICESKTGNKYGGVFKIAKNPKGFASLAFDFAKKK